MTVADTKTCAECFQTFARDGSSGWGNRRYCSTTCSNRAAARRGHPHAKVSSLAQLKPAEGWQQKAACDGADLSEFYDYEEHYIGDAAKREARAVITVYCERCPVRQQCLFAALAGNERWGIWGGVTHTQREALAAYWRRKLHKTAVA